MRIKTLRVGALGFGLAALVSLCAAAAPEPVDARVSQLVREMRRGPEIDFGLPPALALDPALRAEAEKLAQQQIERALALLQTWAQVEVGLLKSEEDVRDLSLRMLARYHNEMALWQLDSTGEAYDRQTLQAWADPGWCARQSGYWSFAVAMLTIQHLPPAERAEALNAQRVLLERWGQPRQSLPARPVPSLVDRAAEIVRALGDDPRPSAEPPLTPLLAWVMLSKPARRIDSMARCSLGSWWLHREQARGSTDVTALALALRYNALMDPVERFSHKPEDDLAAPGGYSRIARRFGIEGQVGVRGRPAAGGKGLDGARVVVREITMPGIRGVRPVAFETVLDAGSLARARSMDTQAAPAGEERQVQFVWKLEP